jgi:hypothetical protein
MNLNDQTIAQPEAAIGRHAFDFWRELRRSYGFPLTMFTLAIVPGLNFVYSGHGGPAWFLIPLCFPYVLLRALFKLVRTANETRLLHAKFFAVTIPCYIAMAFPLSWAATTSLHNTFGLTIPTWSFIAIMISPFPYWYFS